MGWGLSPFVVQRPPAAVEVILREAALEPLDQIRVALKQRLHSLVHLHQGLIDVSRCFLRGCVKAAESVDDGRVHFGLSRIESLLQSTSELFTPFTWLATTGGKGKGGFVGEKVTYFHVF